LLVYTSNYVQSCAANAFGIIRDADYFHLDDNYSIKCNMLRKRMGKVQISKFTDLETKRKFESIISKSMYPTIMLLQLAVSKKKKHKKVIEQEILNMENDFNNPQRAIKTKKRKKKGYERKSRGDGLILFKL
jgi:FtsZ-binding cell division protein ZapB